MRTRISTTIGLGLVLAGCQAPYGKGVPVAAQPASLVCAGYGLRVGTPTYDTCVAYQNYPRPSLSKPVGAALSAGPV